MQYDVTAEASIYESILQLKNRSDVIWSKDCDNCNRKYQVNWKKQRGPYRDETQWEFVQTLHARFCSEKCMLLYTQKKFYAIVRMEYREKTKEERIKIEQNTLKMKQYQVKLKEFGYEVDINGIADNKTIIAHHKYLKKKKKEEKRKRKAEKRKVKSE